MLLFTDIISQKIKIILLLLIFSIIGLTIYFMLQVYSIEEKEQKSNGVKYVYYNDRGGLIQSKRIPKIIDRLVNWGYKIPPTPRLIDTIIIHSSYDALGVNPYSVEGVIYEYKIYGVSPHYLIDRKGTIFRLVKDEYIAYHAGKGKMPDGRININSFSIGIELINTEKDEPTENQYLSLIELVKFLKSKYKIKYILGHNEISPEQKNRSLEF